MLDTKRSRGWVIAAVVGAWLVVGGVVAAIGDRELDEQTDALVDAAHARFDDVDPATVPDLVTDDATDTWVGERSELTELLVLDGRDPDLVSFEDFGFVAHYEIDTWGRQATVVVEGSADGFDVVTE